MPYPADGRGHAGDLTRIAALLTLAIVLGYLESVVLPSLPVPGVRLGLANIAVVVALALFGVRAAAIVSVGRVLLLGLATATLGGPVFALSLAGALAALLVMSVLASAGRTFSLIGWSVAGSAAHVAAQLAVAALLVGSRAPVALLPVSLGLSIPLGFCVGHVARLLISRVPDWSVSAVGR